MSQQVLVPILSLLQWVDGKCKGQNLTHLRTTRLLLRGTVASNYPQKSVIHRTV